jgi:hypothetical protein
MNLDALSDKSTALENLGANPSAVDLAEVDSGYASAVAHANRWGAGAPLATAGGTLGQSYFDHDAKNDEASSVAAEHRADHQIRALDQIKDDIDDANELEDKAYDFLDQVSETRADTDQAVFIRG